MPIYQNQTTKQTKTNRNKTNKNKQKQTKHTKLSKTKKRNLQKQKSMSNITTKPQKPLNVDMGSVSYSAVKSLPSGAKIIYLNYKGGPLFVQTPEMTVPYDSGTFYADNDSSGKYAIKVSMDGHKDNPQMKAFHDMLQGMDQKIMDSGIENSLAWFKKKSLTEEIAKELYTPMVKVSIDSETGEPNGKWAPTFAFKIVKRDGKVQCDCYDADKKEVPLTGDDSADLSTMFKKGTKVKMILKCNGLWIASGKFGCTWRAEQIKINSPIEYSGYAFSDDEDEGTDLTRTESNMNGDKPDNFVESEEEKEAEESAEESEESEESEEEVEEEPEPVKKKVVKKKKKVSN